MGPQSSTPSFCFFLHKRQLQVPVITDPLIHLLVSLFTLY